MIDKKLKDFTNEDYKAFAAECAKESRKYGSQGKAITANGYQFVGFKIVPDRNGELTSTVIYQKEGIYYLVDTIGQDVLYRCTDRREYLPLADGKAVYQQITNHMPLDVIA